MDYKYIVELLPYTAPFLFVDTIDAIDGDGVKGRFTFREEMDFYKGHFKNRPVTPGVILTECCAQIGLASFGLYLCIKSNTLTKEKTFDVVLSSSEMQFLKPVYPNETVSVVSTKIYFRFQKLKCDVKMFNEKKVLVCKGTLSGMIIPKADE